jgi:hypothetical protein
MRESEKPKGYKSGTKKEMKREINFVIPGIKPKHS